METPSPQTDESPVAPPPDQAGPDAEPRSRPPIAIAVAAAIGVVVALALVFALAGDSGDTATDAGGGSELVGLEFLSTDGSTSDLTAFQGQPLVVNFFASWCAPCRAELPDLEQVHLARQDEVTFLGINHDLDEATWRSFVNETEITFQTVFQPQTEIFTALDAKGMPSTAFVAPDGEVLHLHTGLLTDELLEELIDEHLAAG